MGHETLTLIENLDWRNCVTSGIIVNAPHTRLARICLLMVFLIKAESFYVTGIERLRESVWLA